MGISIDSFEGDSVSVGYGGVYVNLLFELEHVSGNSQKLRRLDLAFSFL